MVPRTVLTRSGSISLNAARPVNTVQPRTMVNNAGPMKNVINNAYSTARRPFNKIIAANNSNFNKRVNTVNDKNVNAARPNAVVNTARPKAVLSAGNPQQDLKDKGVIDSGCSRHMTRNRSYLTGYKEIDGGFVAFGGNSKGWKSTEKGKIRTGKLDFKDVYFVKELKFNLFSVSQMCDKKNSVLFTDTACVVLSPGFKLTDESHVLLKVPRKDNMLGHVNFKTMNKLVKGNLVRGLPSKHLILIILVLHVRRESNTESSCRKHALNFMRPFGCPVTILNTIDHLGSGPNWLFDKPVVTGNQSNGSTCTKACDNTGKARMEIIPGKDYILLPLSIQDPSFFSSLKDSPDAGFKPSGEEEKKDAEDPGNKDSEVTSTKEPRVNQENDANVNSTNNIKTVSLTVNAAGIVDNAVTENIVYGCADDDDEDVGAEADINNLDTHIPVSPILTTKIHKDHPVEQIIRDIYSVPQTRRMSKKEPKKVIQALKYPRLIEAMQEELLKFKLQQVWTLVDLPNGKRAIGTKWVYRNKKDERDIVTKNKARLVTQGYTQEEGIDYDEVFAPVARTKAIRLFLAYASFKDFMVYQMDVNSAFLYGKIEEEFYVCQPLGFEDPDFPDRVYKRKDRQEVRRDKGLQVKQKEDGIFISQDKYVTEILKKFGISDVKTASTPMETHKPLLRDANGEDVDEHLYRSMIGSLMYLTSSRPDIMFVVCACARFHVNLKNSHLHTVKRIFRYLKGQPKLGIWYPKDSPFDLVAYINSDYARASLDRKSTTGGCQFLRV
ncbi:putative ribonuclease H-like domain-containing protein [Tanacetum coccineum]